jgi:hypothetical protein
MIRGDKGASILIVAVLAASFLNLSAQAALGFPDILAFLGFSAALGLLFLQFEARLPAAAGLAFFAMHPFAAAALRSHPDERLVASLAGIAAALIIMRWKPETPWHRWASLIPAAACVVLHGAGVAFAPLMVAMALLFQAEPDLAPAWPAFLVAFPVSIAAAALHRGDPYPFATIPPAAMATLAGFLAPFDSAAASGWNMFEGLIAIFVVVGVGVYNGASFKLPGVTFGLVWFLAMILAAPAEPVAALPGLALALSSALAVFLPRESAGISQPEATG